MTREYTRTPPGLFRLCIAEMFERAAYYGMRGLLVLFLVSRAGWSNADALALYGTFTLFVYLLPIPGGFLADLFLGHRKAAVLGGVLMLVGYLLLAVPAEPALYLGVGLLLLGNALFKPSIVTLLGGLYPVESAQRDGGFTLYYLGVNIGALGGMIGCGIVGEFLGWPWAFGAAGVFMLLGLVSFLAVPAGRLKPPGPDSVTRGGPAQPGIIAILAVFAVLFWVCYELSNGPINNAPTLNWTLLGAQVSAGMFSNLGAWLMLLLAPLFGVLWIGLGTRDRGPTSPAKMGLGFLLMALAFAFMFGAWKEQQLSNQASATWLLMTHLVLCLGELCFVPIALSMVTRLAPARFPAMTVGIWFLTNLVANRMSIRLAGSPEGYTSLETLLFTGGAAVVTGAFLLALAPVLGRWLHDATTRPSPEAPAPSPAHPAA